MVAGKERSPSKSQRKMKDLEGWNLHIDVCFTITQTWNNVQGLADIGVYTEVDVLEQWKSRKNRFNACGEIKDAIREYYGGYYKPDRAINEISDLNQTGTVQKYLKDMHKLNVYAEMTDQHLFNIILNAIIPCLRQAMAHYEDLCTNLYNWKEKLLHMDSIGTKFEQKEQDNERIGQKKNRSLKQQVQLSRGKEQSAKKNAEFVPKEAWDKQTVDGRCMKCRRSNHWTSDCKAPS